MKKSFFEIVGLKKSLMENFLAFYKNILLKIFVTKSEGLTLHLKNSFLLLWQIQ